jgi:hypothetical protein
VGTSETANADDGTSEAMAGGLSMSAPPLQLPNAQVRDETNPHALASPNVWQRTRKSCQNKDWVGLANESTAMALVRDFMSVFFVLWGVSYRFLFFRERSCEMKLAQQLQPTEHYS